MDWGKLKSFHAAAETGSLTAAATKLSISQSAVSRQIAALEAQVNVTLFHRHARGLLLTEAGKLLHKSTQLIWEESNRVLSLIQDVKEKPSGLLRINAPVVLGSTWLASHLSSFMDRYPEINMELFLDDVELDLTRFEADVALRPYRPTQPDLVARKLVDIRVGLYASKSYIARYGLPETPKDLDRHKLITYGHSAANGMEILLKPLQLGRPADNPRAASLLINNIQAMMLTVNSGLGIAALPGYIVRNNENLHEVLSEEHDSAFELYYVYPMELKGSHRILAFRDYLMEETSNYQWTQSADDIA